MKKDGWKKGWMKDEGWIKKERWIKEGRMDERRKDG